ncbi:MULTISPECIES: hypothetical protein [Nocardia]|uniref:Uncharacterized protein n=1 Tax=Nocardia vulneris TaxID=1141657 RepID=A0ABR4ZML4_9NOCA|nr:MULTISPECIES: hypothetical protein [Nocardia]ASF09665.1 hypothetical protein CEQ30_22445 [Nocardia brasiliensis]KIA66651.1 hypothetical protein FG87_00580 [Nocardia vulneris]GAJ86348.1 hypothetical protein NBRGN_110_00100 [Nocardia brasiliensis NBRC 14402]SUB55301.1 Uncharacterised protein [Nocardia brasiliensis]
MFDSRNIGSGGLTTDALGGLLDVRSAPVTFGYYEQNEATADAGVEWNTRSRTAPIGWWNRHRHAQTGFGLALITTLAFVPAVQNAILTVLTHAG